ncbi:TonB-linked outer membrane protein, SusC/RagA family [Chitinophaga jiangningensis]|uniref:TonB-linked outer membrane protein, SusC/RagA family n=1 Tax=Chitinophaga jiangningensis TaxID=1419482 RepID=A0A1M6Z2X0_9BACT|nr:TonB-dependent receptor [Chitinophaga jiangningensis]SHL24836.1 TonB-linked outer membrane protein, SusC/RagA family [Chitinophaga jiangningensis]
MKKFIYPVLCICLLMLAMPALAQNSVSGVVTEGAQPLIGVSIFEKDLPSNGVATDEKGRFTLNLKGKSHILIFSYVGYLKREIPAAQAKGTVVLSPDVKGMEDVVVIGYATPKKPTVTGAVSSISGAQIRQSPSASLQNALAGRLPGLFTQQRGGQPGKDGAVFSIRGNSSYNTSDGNSANNPLIIVDDIEFSYEQVAQLDPNEIESISILKDASTTAVYGIRGANGVMVISTRRGKSGKPMLTVRNETGALTPTRPPKMNDGYTTLSLLREYETLGLRDPAVKYPQFFANDNLEYYKDNSDPYLHPYVNWWDVLMKDYSLQNRTNFDISGGSDQIKYFISLGYLTQGGIFKNFSKGEGYNSNHFYNRYNFRSNIDIDPTKDLHIRVDLSGRFGTTNEPNDKAFNGGGTTFQYMWNGELSSFGYPVYNENGTFGSSLGAANSTGTKMNPVAVLKYSGYKRSYENNFNVVASAVQKLDKVTKGLSANLLVSLASDYSFEKSLTRANNEILTYYYDAVAEAYKPTVNNLYRMGRLSAGGGYRGSARKLNLQGSLNYARSFGDHNITALALFNQITNTTNSWNGSDAVDAGIPNNFRGFTGRIGYNYKLKYLLDVNAGYNGSDRFAGGKKYGLFPAIGVGWNISEEPFFKENIPFIDAFKIRGSYGLVGSDKVGAYKYLYEQIYKDGKGYNFGENSTNASGIVEGDLGNDEVTWEKERKTDIGVDIKLLNGKIGIVADYFDNYRYDILSTRGTVPLPIGIGLPPMNLGRVSNKGYEVEIEYNNRSHKVQYFMRGQVSFAKNKILYMDEANAKYPWMAQTGKSIGQQFGYKYIGMFEDIEDLYKSPKLVTSIPQQNLFPGALKFADLNGDGIIDENDKMGMGVNLPRYITGFSFGFSYKGFDFSTLFQGSFDYVINIQRGSLAYSRPERQSTPFNLGRWTPWSTDASYPSIGDGQGSPQTSTYWFRRGDYVRWKNVEFGYAVPASLLKHKLIKSIRIYGNGYNMALVYNKLPVAIDPESAVTSSIGEYPQQRIYNLGIQVGL